MYTVDAKTHISTVFEIKAFQLMTTLNAHDANVIRNKFQPQTETSTVERHFTEFFFPNEKDTAAHDKWRQLQKQPHFRVLSPGHSLVKEHCGIDPDFRERSLTKWFVPVTALSFFGIKKNTSIPAVSVM